MLRALPLLALFVAGLASADAMRCGTKLAVQGDTRSQVRAKCGEPEEIDTRTTLRRPLVWLHGRPVYLGDGLVEVPVEVWVYNFGPHKLMRRLTFTNGELTKVETLGHGYL